MGSDFDHLEFAASELIRTAVEDEEFAELLVGMGYHAMPERALPHILDVLLKAGGESVYQVYLNFLDHDLEIPSEVATLAFLLLAEDISRLTALACLKIYLRWEGLDSLRDPLVRWKIVEETYGDHEHFHIFRRIAEKTQRL